jgi:glycerophosphoryl diester phosphodiesterase
LHLYKDLLLKNAIEYQKKGDYPIRVWTVNEVREMEQLLQMKHIDTIMTDYPKEAISLRNAKS